MAKRKKLSKRQLAVIEDMFAGELTEHQVLDKHRVSRAVYNRWLADEQFGQEFDCRIASAYRQSAVLIARYAPLAAAKLVALTDSEKEETARKACLDILADRSSQQPGEPKCTGPASQPTGPLTGLSADTASRLLAALAEEQ